MVQRRGVLPKALSGTENGNHEGLVPFGCTRLVGLEHLAAPQDG